MVFVSLLSLLLFLVYDENMERTASATLCVSSGDDDDGQ